MTGVMLTVSTYSSRYSSTADDFVGDEGGSWFFDFDFETVFMLSTVQLACSGTLLHPYGQEILSKSELFVANSHHVRSCRMLGINQQQSTPLNCCCCCCHTPCLKIRAAIGSFTGAKVIIVESCIASNMMSTTHTPRICGDVHMMVQYGDAKERTESEFSDLLTAAGFKLNKLLPTKSLFFVLEASPV